MRGKERKDFTFMVGKQYSNLLVLSIGDELRPNSKYTSRYAIAECKCGTIKKYGLFHILSGHSTSCGCNKGNKISQSKIKHGSTHTRLYNLHKRILSRCYNPKNPKYKNYGGRGIIVCDEWKNDFTVFRDWALQNGWNENLKQKDQSIDRIDVNGNYEPNNCRFVDNKIQSWNKTNTIKYEYNGKTYNLNELSIIMGIGYDKLYRMHRKGGIKL